MAEVYQFIKQSPENQRLPKQIIRSNPFNLAFLELFGIQRQIAVHHADPFVFGQRLHQESIHSEFSETLQKLAFMVIPFTIVD